MDSLTQAALGAAVGVAVLGRRMPAGRAALAGAVCGTLPDLDAFIDHGSAIANMTRHRAESHALAWQTLASLPIAAALAWSTRRAAARRAASRPAAPSMPPPTFARWWLMVWLALVTHALLDAMTVYGTRLGLPFTDTPFAVGSIFIIDPLYTLPLLVGTGVALARRRPGWNRAGLALSSAYLAWSVLAQQHVTQLAASEAQRQGVAVQRMLVTPAAFGTVLWRIVIVSPGVADGGSYREGFHSLLDARGAPIDFVAHARGVHWLQALADHPPLARLVDFAHGFVAVRHDAAHATLVASDLRMGIAPDYSFAFEVARLAQPGATPHPIAVPPQVGSRPDLARALDWAMRRTRGEPLPPFSDMSPAPASR